MTSNVAGQIQRAMPVLDCTDMARSVAFYEEKLGFDARVWGEPVSFAIMQRGAVTIALAKVAPGAVAVAGCEFYRSAGCGYCRALRTYLQARGISYREQNSKEARATREAFYARGGQGTPRVVIGSRRIHGFDPFAIEAARAAELDP